MNDDNAPETARPVATTWFGVVLDALPEQRNSNVPPEGAVRETLDVVQEPGAASTDQLLFGKKKMSSPGVTPGTAEPVAHAEVVSVGSEGDLLDDWAVGAV